MKTNIKHISIIGAFIAISMIFSYIESMVPSFIPLPGAKLGLANIVNLLALFIFGPLEAFIIGAFRVFLSALMFGNMISFFMSLSGFLLSYFIMLILYRTKKFSVPGISLAGGAFHNVGQLICASVYMGNSGILSYMFLFVVFGVITGLIIGFLGKMIYETVKTYDWISERNS